MDKNFEILFVERYRTRSNDCYLQPNETVIN